MTQATTTTQTYHLFIHGTAEQIWAAITTPEATARYLFGALVDTTAEVGTPFRYTPRTARPSGATSRCWRPTGRTA
jgi:uncharacterized protein YndB with AHSA1/START domain